MSLAQQARTTQPAALLTVGEVAARLGVTVRHVRQLVFERRIPYLKWGRLVRFDPHELELWLDGARHDADLRA